MNAAKSTQQRGLSFGGFIFGAFMLVTLSIFGFRLIPAYIQSGQISTVFSTISHDPEMRKATVQEIRNSFNRRSAVDNITAIKSDDIDISTDDGTLILSANYTVKIPLVANASLLLEFNPTSGK